MNSLSLILWLPAFGAVLIAFLPAEQARMVRAVALVNASLALLLSWRLLFDFDFQSSAMQFTEHFAWSPATGVSYALGVDGLALAMVLLTSLLSWVALLASWTIKEGIKGYHAWFLVLESSILGVFMAQDWTFFFYVLGNDLDPAVFPYRLVGRCATPSRQPEIRVVHHGRFGFYPGGLADRLHPFAYANFWDGSHAPGRFHTLPTCPDAAAGLYRRLWR